MCEWTESDKLRKHMRAVEAAMRAYAKKFGEDEEKWGITGLLHDFDYEKHPSTEEHPFVGVEYLRKEGYPEDMLQAILGHATYSGVARESMMAKTLFAVDELCGMVMACAYVRPDGIEGMKPKSVKKKLKDKNFAAGVNRDDVNLGIEEMGVDRDEHIQMVIDALAEIKDELGI